MLCRFWEEQYLQSPVKARALLSAWKLFCLTSPDRTITLCALYEEGLSCNSDFTAHCRTLKWPLIDKDDSKDVLVSQPTGLADHDANLAAYRIMFRTAQTQLENGMCSILDSPLARVELYHQALDAAPKVCHQAGA